MNKELSLRLHVHPRPEAGAGYASAARLVIKCLQKSLGHTSDENPSLFRGEDSVLRPFAQMRLSHLWGQVVAVTRGDAAWHPSEILD